MKKDFIVRRSITMVEGKPHVETYSEQELIRCKDCKWRGTNACFCKAIDDVQDDWFCSEGERREGL